MIKEPLHATDFYKVEHRVQYPRGTELVFANWTARRSRDARFKHVVFFGLQAYVHKMVESWQRNFFERPLDLVLASYRHRIGAALPGSDVTAEHIEALWRLKYLPIAMWALPEGTHVPIGVPMFVMWNTVPEFFWLTNYIETSLSANLWGPCTAATIARRYREILDYWSAKTGGDPSFVPWQGHDFSFRGMYGDEAAAMSGAAHLLSFMGTDTIPAIDFLEDHYGGGEAADAIGGSVAATEHSVMCMGTREAERDTYRRLLGELYPRGVVSIVSDTWDYWKVLTETLPSLKAEIMARDGKLVIRPDSGDPVDILTGDDDAPKGSAANLGSFELLWQHFGGTVNEKGFRTLDPHVGLIYGDSITLERAELICARLAARGFVPNVVLGIGSYTYQFITRDTFGFALKSTAGIVNGERREIFKNPATDDGTKRSARGFITVDRDLRLVQCERLEDVMRGALELVFEDGHAHRHETLRQIRDRMLGFTSYGE